MKTFTRRLLTNQTNQTQSTESDHMTTTSSVPCLLLLPTVDYLCFLFVSSSSVKTLSSSHHKSAIWFSFFFPPSKNLKVSVEDFEGFLDVGKKHCQSLTSTKNNVDSVLHIFKRNYTQHHLNYDVFVVDFYDRITGDSKEGNTVLPPVRQLNVSDLLCTDLYKAYC